MSFHDKIRLYSTSHHKSNKIIRTRLCDSIDKMSGEVKNEWKGYPILIIYSAQNSEIFLMIIKLSCDFFLVFNTDRKFVSASNTKSSNLGVAEPSYAARHSSSKITRFLSIVISPDNWSHYEQTCLSFWLTSSVS